MLSLIDLRRMAIMVSFGVLALLAETILYAQATTAHAAPSAPEARPAPGTIDLVRSRVYVKVDKTGFGHQHGVVGQLSAGQVLLGQPQQAGSMKFDLRTFTADGPDARRYVGIEKETDAATQKKVNTTMQSAQVLDIAKFPEATFTIQSAQRLPGDDPQKTTYDLIGELTLHDIKRPLRFQAQAESSNNMLLLRGSFPLVQTEFGIKPYSAAFGAAGVVDKLQVWGELWIWP